MAVATVAHKPGLTKEQAREIFSRHFAGKYTIEDWKGPPRGLRDFVVVKSAFVAVTVKLDQDQNNTKFIYSGFTPKFWARVLSMGVLTYFLWNSLTTEVKRFIETAPEFH